MLKQTQNLTSQFSQFRPNLELVRYSIAFHWALAQFHGDLAVKTGGSTCKESSLHQSSPGTMELFPSTLEVLSTSPRVTVHCLVKLP